MKKITLSVAALALAINTYSQEFFDVTPYLKDSDSVFVDYNFRDVDTTDLVNVFQLRERMLINMRNDIETLIKFINKDSNNNKISRDLADKYINILKYISSKTYNFNETFEYRK
tara:strand:+ start:1089 stop:1430 length:342 start_codon:yes stop_codon:yes gene_type:complete